MNKNANSNEEEQNEKEESEAGYKETAERNPFGFMKKGIQEVNELHQDE